jgi:hypothetical protein
MNTVNRRAFLGASLGAASSLWLGGTARALTCVTSGLPAFLPAQLTIDCASKFNFRLFRKNTKYMGLACVVNQTYVRNKFGAFEAGNLFLFPWLKPAGVAQTGKVWGSLMPVSLTQSMAREPIKGSALPLDEYFCQVIMGIAPNQFIGCLIDVPYSSLEARFAWFDNPKLADGSPAGFDWHSSNLNNVWFGGSRMIPDDTTCNGVYWRKLIVNAVSSGSTAAAC